VLATKIWRLGFSSSSRLLTRTIARACVVKLLQTHVKGFVVFFLRGVVIGMSLFICCSTLLVAVYSSSEPFPSLMPYHDVQSTINYCIASYSYIVALSIA
jgi:hypothetical protein